MEPLIQLELSYRKLSKESSFRKELKGLLANYAGRPTPLYLARNLTQRSGGAKIYLKREELNHTGAHKVNNVLGQILLARHMGKNRIIAETGAGMHGVATATLCARFGLECIVYMGAVDVERQKANVFRMNMLGAKVVPVGSGSRTLKDAINEALRDWVTNVEDTYYLIGSVVGPHPYPTMVRDFQSIIGIEARRQILQSEGHLPRAAVACVGGGSNSMGLFHPFLHDLEVDLYGVEAGGEGLDRGRHAAPLCAGREGVFHGMLTYILQDANGQIQSTHSISAGLDYPGVGPEHAFLMDTRRAKYAVATDNEALEAFQVLSETEGIMPALEPAHALSYATKLAGNYRKNDAIIVNLSGRGDKDVETVAKHIPN